MNDTNPQSQIANQKLQIPKRFIDPDVLNTTVVKHIARFFDRFHPLLTDRNLPLPQYPAGTEENNQAWANLDMSPVTLRNELVESVRAIEELAAPENRALLE